MEHPRFTCRREGHVSCVRVRSSTPGSVLVKCERCGRLFEREFDVVPELVLEIEERIDHAFLYGDDDR